jgi:hypothetical protein
MILIPTRGWVFLYLQVVLFAQGLAVVFPVDVVERRRARRACEAAHVVAGHAPNRWSRQQQKIHIPVRVVCRVCRVCRVVVSCARERAVLCARVDLDHSFFGDELGALAAPVLQLCLLHPELGSLERLRHDGRMRAVYTRVCGAT